MAGREEQRLKILQNRIPAACHALQCSASAWIDEVLSETGCDTPCKEAVAKTGAFAPEAWHMVFSDQWRLL